MTKLIYSILPLLYASSIWAFSFAHIDFILNDYLWFLLISTAVLSGFYLFLRRLRAPIVRWQFGMFIFACAPILTPSLLQTDQLRYIWDGLHMSQGVNPYSFTPQSVIETMPQGVRLVLGSGADLHLPWARYINHPGFFTVYPPLAELLFAFSTHLNPFFSAYGSSHWLPWMQHTLPHFIFWPWELGLRILVGGVLAALIYLLKCERWDLFLFHPLVFLTAIANIHVDTLMLPLLALIFFPNRLTRFLPHGSLLSAATLTRWLPGLFIPTSFVQLLRRYGVRFALLLLVSVVSVCGVVLFYFWLGSQGNMLSSPKAYAEQWYFFGYLHRFVMDLLILAEAPGHPAQWAKAILTPLFLVTTGFILFAQWQGKISFHLASLLVLTFFFMMTPTLHPWYLLSLLFLGVRYQHVFTSVWVWPLLAPLSYVYYFNMADVSWVRVIVYLVISGLLLQDGRLLLKRIRRLSGPSNSRYLHKVI